MLQNSQNCENLTKLQISPSASAPLCSTCAATADNFFLICWIEFQITVVVLQSPTQLTIFLRDIHLNFLQLWHFQSIDNVSKFVVVNTMFCKLHNDSRRCISPVVCLSSNQSRLHCQMILNFGWHWYDIYYILPWHWTLQLNSNSRFVFGKCILKTNLKIT